MNDLPPTWRDVWDSIAEFWGGVLVVIAFGSIFFIPIAGTMLALSLFGCVLHYILPLFT